MPYVEVATVKDFPGSWAEYRVFEGGILQVHRRISSPAALAWSERCRTLYAAYGLDYTAPDNLDRLRSRGLSAKRGLAQREFALGIESLERFVRGEPLRRVHECVFGVLALESEPVDPRL